MLIKYNKFDLVVKQCLCLFLCTFDLFKMHHL